MGLLLFWERVWAFEPCSTNRFQPIGDAAPQVQVNPTLSAKYNRPLGNAPYGCGPRHLKSYGRGWCDQIAAACIGSYRVLMPARQCRPEVGMLLLATLLLATGILVYALDRGGAVYFLSSWTASLTASDTFGPLGDHLPTFLHTLVFILITAAILRPWPRLLPAICATWFVVECLFELGQLAPIDARLASALPAWFDGVPVLEITTDFFIRGTYDPLDILSIGLAAVIAYPLAHLCLQGDQS
jgi:hypothetical protein